MNKNILLTGTLLIVLSAGLSSGTAWSQTSNDFDDHWLAAACAQAPVGGRILGKVVETDYGVAVKGKARKTIVLYCNIDADSYHNQLQLVAEDDSPNVHVTATVFQQNLFSPGDPPEVIVSVTTVDQPGVQVATAFFDPALEPNEFIYMYYVKIEIVRSNSNPVLVYSVSLQDVL